MRILAIFTLAATLAGCVSREVVYQRSLAAPHPGLPRSEFEQIAELLSYRPRQSITGVQRIPNNELQVHTAFPGAEGSGLSDEFSLAKRNGRWYVLEGRDVVIVE